jgi:hypothetical protein
MEGTNAENFRNLFGMTIEVLKALSALYVCARIDHYLQQPNASPTDDHQPNQADRVRMQ